MHGEEYVSLPPTPVALMESLRDIGYTIESAIADVVDNSVSAKARHVWIRHAWNSGRPWLAVIDDGTGMDKRNLIAAMRFGTNPKTARASDDLGRFGLGLKTASLSQCRRLTVLSKRDGATFSCEWDLDQLATAGAEDWRLKVSDYSTLQHDTILGDLFDGYLSQISTGTIVLWRRFDRIEDHDSNKAGERAFNAMTSSTERHLSAVYHQYLKPPRGFSKVEMSVNEATIEARDPFNLASPATQELQRQELLVSGTSVLVQPYVLPHQNKISRDEYERHAGEGGYLQNQGFYVYRNRRLIVSGTWFRLLKKEELTKLLRVRVEIPNTLDHLWRIDVRKSSASPPSAVREELRQFVGRIRNAGRTVYRQRGRRLVETRKTPVWGRVAAKGQISYEINREHPLVRDLLDTLPAEKARHASMLLSTIEGSFPSDLFFSDMANDLEKVNMDTIGKTQLAELLDFVLGLSGSESEMLVELRKTDPFVGNPETTEELLRQRGLAD
jgi:hypothetical protein